MRLRIGLKLCDKQDIEVLSVKKVIAVMILGLVAGAVLGIQQVISLTPEMERQVVSQLGSKQVVIVIAMLQTAVMASIATIVGSWASQKVRLNKPFI
jgi:hypothetical protein